MEDQEKYEQETDTEEGTGSWMRDNLRIIISIIIVVAIAGGVYSYSKRNQAPANNPADEQIAENEQTVEVQKNEEQPAVSEQKQPATEKIATSQETEGSFIETAAKGDGQTHLARRALANYLEKNPDSALTAEHKIYIEDYLRKNSGFKNGVRVGTSVEFSKDLVKKAIENSKKLNDKQLNNLHKYAVRVPSLA
jgi:cytoskeletal protein RodZ